MSEAKFSIVDADAVSARRSEPSRVSSRSFVDVMMFDTPDGGEIEIVHGRTTMDRGFATAVYLSFFGGNAEDNGGPSGAEFQWWGNFIERYSRAHLRSETQHLLKTLPATPANLRAIEDAAARDLAWMHEFGVLEIRVEGSMPRANFVSLEVEIDFEEGTFRLEVNSPWGDE